MANSLSISYPAHFAVEEARELIEFAVRDAYFTADLVGRYLAKARARSQSAEPDDGPVKLPSSFLLELGAVLRVMYWEMHGVLSTLDPSLPRSADAFASLMQRLEDFVTGRVEKWTGDEELHRQVFRASVARMARTGRRELNAEIVLASADANLDLHALADFLWTNRHLADQSEA
jgi:hypothetical protein